MIVDELGRHLRGDAAAALERFYDLLPRIPRARWPELLHGMGYNFEHYDALFAAMVVEVQRSLDGGDYTARHRAMQLLLLPLCSEFGIEIARPLAPTHRALYADFFRAATGAAMPERYPPDGDGNPWLAASRRWAKRMAARVACAEREPVERARFALGYCWAVEHLSIAEFALMREAWRAAGVVADYLDAHCAVEGEHDDFAARAVAAFTRADDPVVAAAIRAHEEDLAGYYRDVAAIAEV